MIQKNLNEYKIYDYKVIIIYLIIDIFYLNKKI